MKTWPVDGVHAGKKMQGLPITYLLWFVGSPVMRRVRWECCQVALAEVARRLSKNIGAVEGELLAGLQPKLHSERLAIKKRRTMYKLEKGAAMQR